MIFCSLSRLRKWFPFARLNAEKSIENGTSTMRLLNSSACNGRDSVSRNTIIVADHWPDLYIQLKSHYDYDLK